MSWWRRKTAEQLLLDSFLKLEADRLAHRSDLEAKREELEVKKLEIELTHLEARTKAQIDLDSAAQELRLKKREAGRKGQQKRRAIAQGLLLRSDCGLCDDPNRRDVTIEMVRQHAGHFAAVQSPPGGENHGNGNGM